MLDLDDWEKTLDWIDARLADLGVLPYFFSKELVSVYTMRSSRPTIRRGVRTNYVNGVNLLVDAGFTAAMTTGQVDFSGMS
ncbi:MAG: hypothetical protein WEA75_13125 [Acidimicrobiia bacterium]